MAATTSPYQSLMDQFRDFGTAWNSKNAMQYLGRLLASSEMPFQLGIAPLRQQLLMGLMGSGVEQQEAIRNAMLGSAQAMENQARAQGLQFNPMDFQTQAMMDANATLRNQISNRPMNQWNLLNQSANPLYNAASLGASGFQQTPKGPGFLGQVAGLAGGLLGQGWNPFGGGNSASQATQPVSGWTPGWTPPGTTQGMYGNYNWRWQQ